MDRNASVTEEEFVSFIAIGYVIEGVYGLHAEHHVDRQDRHRRGEPRIRELLLEGIRESNRHQEVLESLLEECRHISALPTSITEHLESRYDETAARTQRQILQEQIRSNVATARFYGDLQAIIDERGLATHIDQEPVQSALDSIRADECDGALRLYGLLRNIDGDPVEPGAAIGGDLPITPELVWDLTSSKSLQPSVPRLKIEPVAAGTLSRGFRDALVCQGLHRLGSDFRKQHTPFALPGGEFVNHRLA